MDTGGEGNGRVDVVLAAEMISGEPSHNVCLETSVVENQNRPSVSQDSTQDGHEFAIVNDQAAAATLMQLQSRSAVSWSHGDADTWKSTTDNPSTARYDCHYGYSRSEDSVIHRAQPNTTTTHGNINQVQNAALYSQSNVQNTILGLDNAIRSMQQQQVNMRQQQVDMYSKQETIANALQNVMSMLQSLTNNNQMPIHNESRSNTEHTNSVSTQNNSRTYNTHAETTPHYINSVEGGKGNMGDNERNAQCRNYTCTVGNTAPTIYPNNTQCSTRAQMSSTSGVNERYPGDDHLEQRINTQYSEANLPYTQEAQCVQDSSGYFPRRFGSGRPQYANRQSNLETNAVKLPPFNGKEDWKVWINRFEAVAERRRWDKETKLDNLLPKLQGKAGDFVFTQLSRNTLACYDDLIKELNSRFRIVETEKTYAAKFSQRTQKPGETAEEFAAELKRLYAKGYKFRDDRTRQEDLVRRFLDGLRDSDARFEIEYNKEPDNIDEAVYHAVNFVQTRHRNSSEHYSDRKQKKYARRTSFENDSASEESDTDGEYKQREHIYRVPAAAEQKGKPGGNGKKKETPEPVSSQIDSMTVLSETKDVMQMFMDQLKEITKQNAHFPNNSQNSKSSGARTITCYGCQQKGHILRECPKRGSRMDPQNPMNQNNANSQAPRTTSGVTSQKQHLN